MSARAMLSLLLGSLVGLASSTPVVDLGYAKYEGTSLTAGVNQFLGMRFAAPPLGNLRFRAPADPMPVKETQDATSFGPICIGTGQQPSDSVAEDCLFVNVFAPSTATELSNLPVWVYIQGGGYASNANANYDGTGVIQQSDGNIVFVNFNYRAGALGFLASENVREDGDLNVGLLDQRKLLEWVQKYISKFGGDPDHVVIHGASAGAGSVAHHLTAYGGRNDHLFVGAIPQSSFWPTQRTVSEMEFQYELFVQDAGCSGAANSMDCLRGLNLSTIAAANVGSPFPGATGTSQWYFLPVIDGDLIVDHMYELFSSGRFIRVPILVQNDNNEGSLFSPNASTKGEVKAFLKDNYPRLTASELSDIMKLYPKMAPLPEHDVWFPSASAAYGDATFICPGIEIAQAAARFGDKVWNSRFNVQDPANTAAGIGTWHTFDTFAIFGCGYAGACDEAYLTINAGIIPITMDYFLSFVRELDPNTLKSYSAPLWKSFGRGQRLRLQTNNTAMEYLPREEIHRCNLWRSLHDPMEY